MDKNDLKIASHEAPGQMAGYLYEALAALLILLQKRSPNSKISIEKVDDVVFDNGISVREAIQIKHHKPGNGLLNDNSVDFWRSINSWCDVIKTSKDDLPSAFIIFSTSSAPRDSIASKLKNDDERKPEEALRLLLDLCSKEHPDSISKFCDNFSRLSEARKKYLLENMTILDSMAPIAKINEEISDEISVAVLPEYKEEIYQSLIGWWFSSIINALSSNECHEITYLSVQTKLSSLVSSHGAGSLPITIDYLSEPSPEERAEVSGEKPIFEEQLEMISFNDNQIKICAGDYLHAKSQISNWLRGQNLLPEEIDQYEAELTNEWKRRFERMKTDIYADGEKTCESDKQRAGRQLLYDIDELNKPIRSNVASYNFLMRGTYQILANDKKVGWHVDYLERLSEKNGDKNGK
jgi:hypothetical protein